MNQRLHKPEKLTGFYQQILSEYKRPFSIDLLRSTLEDIMASREVSKVPVGLDLQPAHESICEELESYFDDIPPAKQAELVAHTQDNIMSHANSKELNLRDKARTTDLIQFTVWRIRDTYNMSHGKLK